MPTTTLYRLTAAGSRIKIIDNVAIANSFWSRLKGLLGKKHLQETEALLISPCKRIHTIGMQFSIDVLFLSREGKVSKITQNIPPNRQAGHKEAYMVIEMLAGMAEKHQLQIGDTLVWKS